MRPRPVVLSLACACLLPAFGVGAGSGGTPHELRAEVARADLEAHVRFLASDELAGRGTGTPGGEAAARYLAEVLAKCGVEPAGDDGTFLQAVPLRRARMVDLPRLVLIGSAGSGQAARFEAVYGRDFEIARIPIEVGELEIVTAKEAAVIPAEASTKQAIFVDAPFGKRERWLEEAGHPEGEGFGLWIKPGSEKAGDEKGLEGAPSTPRPARAARPSVTIRGPLLERLRAGEFAKISLSTRVQEEDVAAHNVVGRIQGTWADSESVLAREAVVVSAHYDHLPPKEERSGKSRGAGSPGDAKPAEKPPGAEAEVDRIFNGADDDASGCAAVLEVAAALAAGDRPQRTVIFLLATGEEIGLLGTKLYLQKPVLPLDATVANLNVEMIGRPDALVGGAGVMWLTGYELSDLGPACAAAGLSVKPDPRPDEHFFERSDNYAFVQRGVVGQTFSTYDLHKDYHTPEDEADKLDYAHMETCTRAILEAVRLVADGKLRPRWVEGREPARR